jgi:hypothetical protein
VRVLENPPGVLVELGQDEAARPYPRTVPWGYEGSLLALVEHQLGRDADRDRQWLDLPVIGLGTYDSAASRVVVSGGVPVAVSYLPHRLA